MKCHQGTQRRQALSPVGQATRFSIKSRWRHRPTAARRVQARSRERSLMKGCGDLVLKLIKKTTASFSKWSYLKKTRKMIHELKTKQNSGALFGTHTLGRRRDILRPGKRENPKWRETWKRNWWDCRKKKEIDGKQGLSQPYSNYWAKEKTWVFRNGLLTHRQDFSNRKVEIGEK